MPAEPTRSSGRREPSVGSDAGSTSESGSECEEDEDVTEDAVDLDGNMQPSGDDGRAPFEGASALDDESRAPLFCGSDLTRLDSTLLFMNVVRTHKVTNACITELLHLFSKVILPKPNSLPTSEGIASSMVTRLGLRYDAIDACRNGCVLFRREYAELETCPICAAGRFKRVGLSRVPAKVLRHFPLVPRLKRMFSTPQLASLMAWHGENMSRDGKMRGPYDSPQWQHVRDKHGEFSADHRNIHLGLCADGVNPYSQKRSTHSSCPVFLLNYNIPPWLTIKTFFIMLSLLIPGPEAVTAAHFDVFLCPLIEELTVLWTEGVMCNDAARWRGEATFTMRAILLWCIADFPAYGMMAGTSNKGYCACPVCGPGTPSRYSQHLSKVVYGGSHRRWLPTNHPFRRDVTVFGKEELEEEPRRMDATAHIRWTFLRAEYARYGGRLAAEGDPMLCSGVKRLPALFTLPYWRVRLLHTPRQMQWIIYYSPLLLVCNCVRPLPAHRAPMLCIYPKPMRSLYPSQEPS